MARTRFYLDNQPLPNGQSIIMIDLTFDGKRLRISSGETVLMKNWDNKKQVVKKSTSGSLEINAQLQKTDGELLKIYRDFKLQDIVPTPILIKKKFKELHEDKTPLLPPEVFDIFEEYINISKVTKGKSAVKGYKVTLNHLKKYEKYRNDKVTFEKMDLTFYDNLMEYFIANKLSNNTIGSNTKNLKAFCRWAFDREYHKNQLFKQFTVLSEESEEVYLTDEELEKITALDLTDSLRLSRVRDLFLLQCYTGLRYSDIVNIRSENIKGNFIKLRAIKTRGKLSVPILPEARIILDKYKETPFPVISNQKMNNYIKELVKKAEINEKIEIVTYIGPERISTLYEKHELISTHTGRRTFVTLSLENGMRPETVMDTTGQKDWRVFRKYSIITERVKEQEMQQSWKNRRKKGQTVNTEDNKVVG